MIPEIRRRFNDAFTDEAYEQLLTDLKAMPPYELDFRIAETPVFVDKKFRQQIIDTCEFIVDKALEPDFMQISEAALPPGLKVPGEEGKCQFMAFDFGICTMPDGSLGPQLIELQGFPTLFGYQVFHDELMRKNYDIPAGFDCYLNGYDKDSYTQLLKDILLDGCAPGEVILLEIKPHEQKTRVDFYCTQALTGIRPTCVTEVVKEGSKLYYKKDDGSLQPVRRIYNRVIFDELQQQPQDIQDAAKFLFEEADVTWVPHPNWFYRISKYTLPSLRGHAHIPETHFLNELETIPADLENYVLKPLFSFAGQGVIIDVTKADIEAVTEPHNFILQRKVPYAEAIETPDGPAKAEIRIFYFWPPGAERPIAVNNLGRLSKGKMIGVRYNMHKTWVGGTLAYFEQ